MNLPKINIKYIDKECENFNITCEVPHDLFQNNLFPIQLVSDVLKTIIHTEVWNYYLIQERRKNEAKNL